MAAPLATQSAGAAVASEATGWAAASSRTGADMAAQSSTALTVPSPTPGPSATGLSASHSYGREPQPRSGRVSLSLSLVSSGVDRYDVLAAEAACVYAVRMRRQRGRSTAAAARHTATVTPTAVSASGAGAGGAGAGSYSPGGAESAEPSTIGVAWGRGAEDGGVPASAAGATPGGYDGTGSGPFPELELSPRPAPAPTPALTGPQLAAMSSLFQPHPSAAHRAVSDGLDDSTAGGGGVASPSRALGPAAPGRAGQPAPLAASTSAATPSLPEVQKAAPPPPSPLALGLQAAEPVEADAPAACQRLQSATHHHHHWQPHQQQDAAASEGHTTQMPPSAEAAAGGGIAVNTSSAAFAVIAVDSCFRNRRLPSDGHAPDALAAGPGSAALSDAFSAYAAGLSEALALLPGPGRGGREGRRRRSVWIQRRSTGSGTAASSGHELSGDVGAPSGQVSAGAAAAGSSSSSVRKSAAGRLHTVMGPGRPSRSGRSALKRSSMPNASALALAATLGRALLAEGDGSSNGGRRSSAGCSLVDFGCLVQQDSPITPRAIQARVFPSYEVVGAAAAGAGAAAAAASVGAGGDGGAAAGVPGGSAAAAHRRAQQLLTPYAGTAEATFGHSFTQQAAAAPGCSCDRRSFESATGSVVTAAGMGLRPSLDAGSVQHSDAAAAQATAAVAADGPAAVGAADDSEDSQSFDSFDTEEDAEPVGEGAGGGVGGAVRAPGFVRGTAGAAGSTAAASGAGGGAATAAATAAVDRYGSLLVGSAGWRYTEMHDVHDSLLMSRLTSTSRWRGSQALGSGASGHNAHGSEGGTGTGGHSAHGGSSSKWHSPAGPSSSLGVAHAQPHQPHHHALKHASRQRRPAALVQSRNSYEVDLGMSMDLPCPGSPHRSPGLSAGTSIASCLLHQLLPPGAEASPAGTAPTSSTTNAVMAIPMGPGGGDAGPADSTAAAAGTWASWYRAAPPTGQHTASPHTHTQEPLDALASPGSTGVLPPVVAVGALLASTAPGAAAYAAAAAAAAQGSDAGGTHRGPASGTIAAAADRPAAVQGRASLDSRLAAPGYSYSHYHGSAAGAGGPAVFTFGASSHARPHHPRRATAAWLGSSHAAGSSTWRPAAVAATVGAPAFGRQQQQVQHHGHAHGYQPHQYQQPLPSTASSYASVRLPSTSGGCANAGGGGGGGGGTGLTSPLGGARGGPASSPTAASPGGGFDYAHGYRSACGEPAAGGTAGGGEGGSVNLMLGTGDFLTGGGGASEEPLHPEHGREQPAPQQGMGWAATLEVLREQVTCPSPPVPSPRASLAGRSGKVLSAGFKLLGGGRSQRSMKGVPGGGDGCDGAGSDGRSSYAPGSDRTTPVPAPLAAARGQPGSAGAGSTGVARVLAAVTGASGSRGRAVSAAGALPRAAPSPGVGTGEAAGGAAAASSPRARQAVTTGLEEQLSRMNTSTHRPGTAPDSPLPAACGSANVTAAARSRTSVPAAGGSRTSGATGGGRGLFARTLHALLPGPRSLSQPPRARSLPCSEVEHAEWPPAAAAAAAVAPLAQAPRRPAPRTLSRLALGRASADPSRTGAAGARGERDDDGGFAFAAPRSSPPPMGRWSMDDGLRRSGSQGAPVLPLGSPHAAATAPPLAHRRQTSYSCHRDGRLDSLPAHDAALSLGAAAAALLNRQTPDAVSTPAPASAAPPVAAGRAARPPPMMQLLCEVREDDCDSAGDPAGSRRGTEVGLGEAAGPGGDADRLVVSVSARPLMVRGSSANGASGDGSAGDCGDGSVQRQQHPARSRLAKLFGLQRSASGGGDGAGVISGGSWTGMSGLGSADEGRASAPASPLGGGRVGSVVRALTRSRLASPAVGGGAGWGRLDSEGCSSGRASLRSPVVVLAQDSAGAAPPGAPSGAGQRPPSGLKTFIRSLWSSKAARERASRKRADAAAGTGLAAAASDAQRPVSGAVAAAGDAAPHSYYSAPSAHLLGALSQELYSQGHAAPTSTTTSRLRAAAGEDWTADGLAKRPYSLPTAEFALTAAAGTAAGPNVIPVSVHRAVGAAGAAATLSLSATGGAGGVAVGGGSGSSGSSPLLLPQASARSAGGQGPLGRSFLSLAARSFLAPKTPRQQQQHHQHHSDTAGGAASAAGVDSSQYSDAAAGTAPSSPVPVREQPSPLAASAAAPGSPAGVGEGQGGSHSRSLHSRLLKLGQRLAGGGSSGRDRGGGQGMGCESNSGGSSSGAATGTGTPTARRVQSMFLPRSHSHASAPDASTPAAPAATRSGHASPLGQPHRSSALSTTTAASATAGVAGHPSSHSRVRAQALAKAHALAQAEAQARLNQLAPLAAALFTPAGQ
ncbi:hypothetical protein HXX76_006490 [Chlamydomonas incerta]|uniref:Uncharacterized protein n=1 Tax=Chlamydomonas incerta TaxID=51695 RepID=A0A835SZQ3_CHLIN|nr:hypothetical protein HXX76_006490 [Chlamydomonas incerta]|eukprot:KAG2436178.1 hypothetical protein HXX76_006490 [Chlamydomonas incerta]